MAMKCDKCDKPGKVVDMRPGAVNVTLCAEHREGYVAWSAWNGRANSVTAADSPDGESGAGSESDD
jgi:hypothetical protein